MTVSFILFSAAVFLFSLARPKDAIFLPIIFHPLYLIRGTIVSLPTTLLEVILICVIAGVSIRYVRLSLIRSFITNNPMIGVAVACIAIFLISATVSAAIAPHWRVAWGTWKAMVVEPVAYAALLVCIVHRYRLERRLLVSFVAGGLIAAIASLAAVFFVTAAWEYPLIRLSGIYDVPNSLAMIMAPMLAVSITAAVEKIRISTVAAIIVFGAVLLATQSIIGIAAAAGGAGAYVFMRSNGRRAYIVVIPLLIAFAFTIQLFSGKLSVSLLGEDSSLAARVQIWQVSLRLIRENPLLGTGLGTFEPAYQDVLRSVLRECPSPSLLGGDRGAICAGPLEWVVRDPHNVTLSFWLHTGLSGAVSMGIYILAAFAGWRSALQRSDHNSSEAILGTAFLALLLFGIADVPYWKNDVSVLWWVLLSIMLLQFFKFGFFQTTRKLWADRV